jgi:hypothetical protein
VKNVNYELSVARGKLEYHERSVSHTFSSSGSTLSEETIRWMLDEGRRLKQDVERLEKLKDSTHD